MDTPPPTGNLKRTEYSTPQRKAVLALKKYAGDKLSNNEIFRRVGVSRSTGYRIMKGGPRRNKEALSRRGRPKKISAEHLKQAHDLLEGSFKNRKVSWDELGRLLGIEAHGQTIRRALQAEGYSTPISGQKTNSKDSNDQ